jgi:hypothetical protein
MFDLDALVRLEMGGKQVSSTVCVKDGRIASMFDEAYRAWSLSDAYWDSISLSSETCNSTGAPSWNISEASYRSLALLVADWCKRYGIPCNRDRVIGHREVYTRHGGSYGTACPGGIDLNRVVNEANAILGGSSPSGDIGEPIKEKKKMSALIRNYDGNVGLVTEDGELVPLNDMNEVESLKATGLVGDYAQMSDGNVWNTLTGITARKVAQRSASNPAEIAKAVAPLLTSSVVDAVVKSVQLQLKGLDVQLNTSELAKAVSEDIAKRLSS